MPKWLRALLSEVEREAWIRFFVAVGALTLSFAAALFSTITKDAGNVIGTAVLASAALLLAGWVALTTVPYLARRVAISRVREALDYDVTREGLAYMLLVLLIGVAALNTGNNLLFIIVSAMLAAIIVSGVASAAMLQRVSMELAIPEHVFATDGVVGRVNVRNESRWWPAFSVSVVPPK